MPLYEFDKEMRTYFNSFGISPNKELNERMELVLNKYNIKTDGLGASLGLSNKKETWLKQNEGIKPKRRNENPFGLSLEDIIKLNEEIKDTHIYDTTFAQDVLEYCYRQGIFRGVDFEEETNINQNEFSKIYNNQNYIPIKRIVISICVALRLTYYESINLLNKAGYTLSPQIPFDKFVMDNSLIPRFYDIEILNNALEQENIKNRLGSMERGEYKNQLK